MNARPKKKLCWNCEGNVSLKAETCPYCGVSVVGLSSDISPETPIPPYKLVNASQEAAIPLAPYAAVDEEASDKEVEEESNEAPVEDSTKEDDSKRVILVLALLLAGSLFFIFGFALFLFSDEGYLSLHWNAAYWFVYLLLSLPMLYLGFRFLNRLSE